jgi:hypothetical protein
MNRDETDVIMAEIRDMRAAGPVPGPMGAAAGAG